MTEPHPDFRIIRTGATVGSGKELTRDQVSLLKEAMSSLARQYSKDMFQMEKDGESQANIDICREAVEQAVILELDLEDLLKG